MKIDVQTRDFSLTSALWKYTQWRLEMALGIREEHIQRVTVRLSDINGPRGGKDKSCRIRVNLDRHNDVVIEDVEEDMYTAIDRAASRAGRAVSRRIIRQRVKDRFSPLNKLAASLKQT